MLRVEDDVGQRRGRRGDRCTRATHPCILTAIALSQGLLSWAPRCGVHRRKRLRRPLAGMMLHQDASSHTWVAGEIWDPVVTMDAATSKVYSDFFVAEEGTMSSLQALCQVVAEKGLFCWL